MVALKPVVQLQVSLGVLYFSIRIDIAYVILKGNFALLTSSQKAIYLIEIRAWNEQVKNRL